MNHLWSQLILILPGLVRLIMMKSRRRRKYTDTTLRKKDTLWKDLMRLMVLQLLLDHEITLKILEFILNLIEKVKPGALHFLNVYISWIERDKILILQLSTSKLMYFADQNGPKRGPHENEFLQFSNVKLSFLNSLGTKCRWKKWGHFYGFMSPSWVMVLKLWKIVSFSQVIFCWYQQKN